MSNGTWQGPDILATASHYSCEHSALSYQPQGLQSLIYRTGSSCLLQLCQVCPSSLHSSCMSALPTLPFQDLSPDLRILKQLPCSFSSNLCYHFPFSCAIAYPVLGILWRFAPFGYFSPGVLLTSTGQLLIV